MAAKPALRASATGNHALDESAYGPTPHLFFNLAVKYPVPAEMLLTVLFLWDRTVGRDAERHSAAGDCALSQIPVRERNRNRWLAALIACEFWEREKAKSGGRHQSGSYYEYKNPTAKEWETFFEFASISRNVAGFDAITPERFGKMAVCAVKPKRNLSDTAVEPQ
jgi:hypothetical protein